MISIRRVDVTVLWGVWLGGRLALRRWRAGWEELTPIKAEAQERLVLLGNYWRIRGVRDVWLKGWITRRQREVFEESTPTKVESETFLRFGSCGRRFEFIARGRTGVWDGQGRIWQGFVLSVKIESHNIARNAFPFIDLDGAMVSVRIENLHKLPLDLFFWIESETSHVADDLFLEFIDPEGFSAEEECTWRAVETSGHPWVIEDFGEGCADIGVHRKHAR
jgi:hypothetical protein